MPWNKADYFKQKAKRFEKVVPQWATNTETGASFYLRRVDATAYAISGAMPHNLTNDAVEGWKEAGVEIPESPSPSRQQIADGNRNVELMARVCQQACVIPKLVKGGTGADELDPADLDASDVVFIFKWATGQYGLIELQGGAAMNVADLKSVPAKSRKRAGTGTDGPEL